MRVHTSCSYVVECRRPELLGPPVEYLVVFGESDVLYNARAFRTILQPLQSLQSLHSLRSLLSLSITPYLSNSCSFSRILFSITRPWLSSWPPAHHRCARSPLTRTSFLFRGSLPLCNFARPLKSTRKCPPFPAAPVAIPCAKFCQACQAVNSTLSNKDGMYTLRP